MLTDDEVTSAVLNLVVPAEPGFSPAQMEVKEASSERGYIPPRVCLLDSDLQTYRVFALPDDPFREVTRRREVEQEQDEEDVSMQ